MKRLLAACCATVLFLGCVGPRLLPDDNRPDNEAIVQGVLDRQTSGLSRLLQAIGLVEGRLYPEHRTELLDIVADEFERLRSDPSMTNILWTLHQAYGQSYSLNEVLAPDSSEESLSRLANEPMPVWSARVSKELRISDLSIEALSEQEFVELQDFATQAGNTEILEQMGMGHMVPAFDPQRAVEATVTVLVDEGISLVNGIGSPKVVVGSGFFIDADGYILTNYHVVQSQVDPSYKGSSKLTVRLYSADGRGNAARVPARVVGYDEIMDIALLKTEAVPPAFVPLAAFANVRPGQEVTAIGSPGGLEHTITSGIVSALGRRFLQLGEVYQVDIPINPGNSGGPVFNQQGMVIGIVFAGIQQFDGVNFIIPSSAIVPILSSLYGGGQVEYPWFGLSLYERQNRLYVSYVAPQGPFGALPVRQDDELVEIAGTRLRTFNQAQQLSLSYSIGEVAVLKFRRPDGTDYSLAVEIGQRPVLPFREILGDALATKWLAPLFGMSISRLTSDTDIHRFRIDRIYAGSPADEAGLNEHDSFRLVRWIFDAEEEIAAIQMSIERRTSGFVPELLQLAVYIAVTNFI